MIIDDVIDWAISTGSLFKPLIERCQTILNEMVTAKAFENLKEIRVVSKSPQGSSLFSTVRVFKNARAEFGSMATKLNRDPDKELYAHDPKGVLQEATFALAVFALAQAAKRKHAEGESREDNVRKAQDMFTATGEKMKEEKQAKYFKDQTKADIEAAVNVG